MEYLQASRIFVLLASISVTFGLYDQALKIWRTKSVKDFTWTIIVAILVNEIAWLNYGLALSEWPVIVIGVANSPAALMIIYGYLLNRKKGVA